MDPTQCAVEVGLAATDAHRSENNESTTRGGLVNSRPLLPELSHFSLPLADPKPLSGTPVHQDVFLSQDASLHEERRPSDGVDDSLAQPISIVSPEVLGLAGPPKATSVHLPDFSPGALKETGDPPTTGPIEIQGQQCKEKMSLSISSPPSLSIPGYKWSLHSGSWCLLPIDLVLAVDPPQHGKDTIDSWANEEVCDTNLGGQVGDIDCVPDTQLSFGSQSSSQDVANDSGSDFEAKIRKILPGSYGDANPDPVPAQEKPSLEGTRRSERHKKPSSRWNEVAGFVAPRSAKKKGTRTGAISPEVPAAKRAKLEDLDSTAKRSLDFLSSQAVDPPLIE
ncbi:hypothetical protein IHE45_11G057900 [Dioscorea alata]|uniref:Uncharacterized protein n=1 Tax=Dioscorea alata TaxID=55571 RepID=A0ACB7V6R3_DIOAL|nr:hypothetical protein IHE45_11G057900 [Dioscorea alata]